MKKLLVCDLDGTLLDQKNNIDNESLNLIKHFIDDGNDFCICTGRLDEDIKYVEKELGVRGAYRISQNGAVIRDINNSLIAFSSIPHKLIKSINQIVFNSGLRVEVSDVNHRYFPSPRDSSQVSEFVDTSIIKQKLSEFTQNKDFQAVIYLIFGKPDLFTPIIKKFVQK